jgi:hypothetical protein
VISHDEFRTGVKALVKGMNDQTVNELLTVVDKVGNSPRAPTCFGALEVAGQSERAVDPAGAAGRVDLTRGAVMLASITQDGDGEIDYLEFAKQCTDPGQGHARQVLDQVCVPPPPLCRPNCLWSVRFRHADLTGAAAAPPVCLSSGSAGERWVRSDRVDGWAAQVTKGLESARGGGEREYDQVDTYRMGTRSLLYEPKKYSGVRTRQALQKQRKGQYRDFAATQLREKLQPILSLH